jgi:hypothetical protein
MRCFIICTPSQILSRSKQEDEVGGANRTQGREVLVGKPEGKVPRGRRKPRWEDNKIIRNRIAGC